MNQSIIVLIGSSCRSVTIFTLVLLNYSKAKSQNLAPVRDGVNVQVVRTDVIDYPHIRDCDIMWSTRIWRTIDLREKMNHPLYYPLEPNSGRVSLFDALINGISKDKIIAYNDLYDDFRQELSKEQISAILNKSKIIQQENPDFPGTFVNIYDTTKIESKNVVEYLIKEDWIFDKQRSVLEVRILGICPVITTYDEETGAERGKTKLFWLYFPNCRSSLMEANAFNKLNPAASITFDQLFAKRIFSSYITKNSNVYDRDIASYEHGLDFFLEGEKIKNDLFIFESDLWQY